jgi:hypothetical protein
MTMMQEPQQSKPDPPAVGGLAELTVECWRLLRLVERLMRDQPPDRQAGALAQMRYARGRIDAVLGEQGMRLIAYANEPYSPNLPVTVVNADEFNGNDGLVITDTLEPTLLVGDRVATMGKVFLKKGD